MDLAGRVAPNALPFLRDVVARVLGFSDLALTLVREVDAGFRLARALVVVLPFFDDWARFVRVAGFLAETGLWVRLFGAVRVDFTRDWLPRDADALRLRAFCEVLDFFRATFLAPVVLEVPGALAFRRKVVVRFVGRFDLVLARMLDREEGLRLARALVVALRFTDDLARRLPGVECLAAPCFKVRLIRVVLADFARGLFLNDTDAL